MRLNVYPSKAVVEEYLNERLMSATKDLSEAEAAVQELETPTTLYNPNRHLDLRSATQSVKMAKDSVARLELLLAMVKSQSQVDVRVEYDLET